MAQLTSPTNPTTSPRRYSTGFLSRSSLPDDPTARRDERRGRLWLVGSFVLCPCHLPVTMALIGVALGGTALGSSLAGHSIAVGVVMGTLYAFGVWRGFRHLRRAKARLAPGERLSCSTDECTVVPAGDGVPSPR